jgi:hypothetical protein
VVSWIAVTALKYISENHPEDNKGMKTICGIVSFIGLIILLKGLHIFDDTESN